MMCFHTTFTCSANFIKKAYQLARENSVRIHMHVSEGNYEPHFCQNQFGKRPIQYYENLGIASPDMVASQCVQIDKDEIEIMKQRDIKMVHMPLSNCEVGGGVAPVPDLLEAGVTVGLGSDGYIEDFFEVMRGAFLIHKAVRQDPRLMPANKVWQMATEGGALALGFKNVGLIRPGWQADLQLIDTTSLPTPLEDHNLYEQLLLNCNASHVKSVWVAGNMLMQDGKVIDADIETRLARTREAAQALWKRTGKFNSISKGET
jgi:cytosine/adenosine deaminase-related metal-dependent hydrolase